jgi:CDGSH-type Zn-finger protein
LRASMHPQAQQRLHAIRRPLTMNKISIALDGPYLVQGVMPLAHQHIVTNAQGESVSWREGQAIAVPGTGDCALCRCGQSATKPFCDGTHQRVGFDGTETASRAPYAQQAEHIEGPSLVLDDAQALCAFARFCDPHGQVWNLVLESDQPAAARLVVQQAGDCPGGRLRARQRAQAHMAGHPMEPNFKPSIGLVQDTEKGVSGPLWVRGGVEVVGADGQAYEVRNRVALCRCGASGNKPFCDGSHASTGFNDAS